MDGGSKKSGPNRAEADDEEEADDDDEAIRAAGDGGGRDMHRAIPRAPKRDRG